MANERDNAYILTQEIIQKLRGDMANHYTVLSPRYAGGVYTIPVKDDRVTEMMEVTVRVKS